MIRDRPEKYGLLQDGDPQPQAQVHDNASVESASEHSPQSADMTVRQALRTSSFWLISLGVALGMFAMSSITVHQFSQMEQEDRLRW